ncbi:MAG TPA: double-strand break repair helicase AddA [Pseudolabrys sp.]
MSKPRIISEAVLNRQREASDPGTSAWVSANAGSGKTHVLAQRVIRLLLDGVNPARILCITFTKAAAGNMANRVFDELRKWTALDDAQLIVAMRNAGARDTGDKTRARARKLFALALETPGGLKVQTIHAFCTHILHLFPFEANVAARFNVLDEAQNAQLLEKITNAVLLDAAEKPQSETGRALSYAIGAVADLTFRELIGKTIRERDIIEAWLDSAGGLDGAAAQLSQALDITAEDTSASLDAKIFEDSCITNSEWASVGTALSGGSKTDKEQGARFHALVTLRGTEALENYFDIFCTKDRAKTKERIVTKKIQDEHPDLCQRLQEERDRIWRLIVKRRAVAARDRTIALVTIAKAVLDRFKLEKNRRGLLDFEDQIDKTHALLSNVSAAWVHYKLDGGIDHVLIDEAQDTSPKQWGIVRHLVAEFFAGKGANENKRTIFAVGDEKQSIFSFQGAAPAEFESMRLAFEALSRNSEKPFRHVRFDTSLRSGANILAAVDTVFERAEVSRSLTKDTAGIPEHISLASAAPGEVEIWDTEKPQDDGGEKDPWNAPFDTLSGSKPAVRLAQKIAKSVSATIAAGRRPGSVLVLVNRRGALFEAIIRALKNAKIPVAGADRLVLTEHIAVMDLMALADALLLPQDDLALATVLKSPLFGFDDDDIFDLAYDRGRKSLHGALLEKSANTKKFANASARLHALSQRVRDESPFSFYARLLGADRGRERFMARLGHEASDALDEFLNLALDFERGETPSLQAFVAWMRAAKSEIKRDMEMDRDEVRVMTVHGAKGLEAPMVFLADTTARPQGHHPPPLLKLSAQTSAPPLIWVKGEKEDVGPMNAARLLVREETQNEHRRLLYVAMTRAAERLIVCGVESKTRPPGCWYDLVLEGLRDKSGFSELDIDGVKSWRYRKVEPSNPEDPELAVAAPVIDKPIWLNQPLAAEVPVVSLTPSNTASAHDRTHTFAADFGKAARLRGTLAHRLVQSLPDIPAERRRAAAQDYLARRGKDLLPEDRARLAEQVMLVLEDPRFYELYGPGSRAEVPIVGRLALGDKTVHISGQIDRLAVTQDAVLIADFKTNRPAPRRIEDVTPVYIRQLSLYRAVLAKLYPDKTIRAALVWTEVPDLIELSAEIMDAAIARINPA